MYDVLHRYLQLLSHQHCCILLGHPINCSVLLHLPKGSAHALLPLSVVERDAQVVDPSFEPNEYQLVLAHHVNSFKMNDLLLLFGFDLLVYLMPLVDLVD